jgi:PhzF family phenazine biosynthesis protein
MATTPCFQVDAFTDRPFTGNPAAVCLLDTGRAARWMQSVAAEMNLSETAFLMPLKTGFRLRWFTPKVEVELCGHATLAAAHVLWSEGIAPPVQHLSFHTRSGVLMARPHVRGIELDFPARPARKARVPAAQMKRLEQALGVEARAVVRVADDALVEVASDRVLRGLVPDMSLLGELPVRGIVVTALAGKGKHDFVSRFFAPAVGVPEDPVTGSAHCALAPYWAARLGRTRLLGYQASARGGEVEVELRGERVLLRGSAVTVARGRLLV